MSYCASATAKCTGCDLVIRRNPGYGRSSLGSKIEIRDKDEIITYESIGWGQFWEYIEIHYKKISTKKKLPIILREDGTWTIETRMEEVDA